MGDTELGAKLGSLRATEMTEPGNKRSVAVLTHQRRDGSNNYNYHEGEHGSQRA